MRFSLPLIVVGLLVCSTGRAGDRTPAGDSAAADVRRVLGLELHGDSIERDKRLKSVLRQSSDFAPARWQSGQVKSGKTWVRFDRLSIELSDDATRTEYRRLRDAAPNTVTGHLRMASWCAKHDLPQQRRAHLTALLEIQPDHPAARKALGHVRVGPVWMSKRQVRENRKLAKQAVQDLKKWAPKLKGIRDGWLSGDRARVNAARKRLWEIDDPAAIPAVELMIGYRSPRLAGVVVEYLGNIRHQESTVALARQAVFSPWTSIRKTAAAKLKSRKPEHFVPQVLTLTALPLESRRMLYVNRGGTLVYRHVFFQEGRNARSLIVFDHRQARINRKVPYVVSTGEATSELDTLFPRLNRYEWLTSHLRNRRSQIDAIQQAKELMWSHDRAANEAGGFQMELSRRIGDLLTTVSRQTFDGNVEQMWNWWDSYSEMESSGPKPLHSRLVRSTSVDIVESYEFSRSSCLAAGTPVWTDRGPVAIDKVRVGDCVLAKNVETGELAYKPVLKTTVRRARPLLKLDIGPRTINVTGGHPFWISGKGWMKARDVTDGMRMHDVTGTTAVRLTGTSKAEPTYNLVVADFHTYFVGEAKVLSHDVTPIEPTDALVPGLVSK
ncbi:MAG: polymorphic toxin-type HINT domain-containing protein [Planctomycetaceae bacterium]